MIISWSLLWYVTDEPPSSNDSYRCIRNFELLTSLRLQMTFIAFCAVCLTGVHYGTGRHYWDLQEHDIQEALMVGVEYHHRARNLWPRN